MANDSKTEKATPKKRRDERKEGHVASSKDVIVVASLLGLFYSLQILLPYIYQDVRENMIRSVNNVGIIDELSLGTLQNIGSIFVLYMAKAILPLGFIGMAIAVVASGIQTRFIFETKPLRFKLSKLNPIKGLKNLFSVKNLVELFKSMLKLILLSVIIYQILKDDITQVAQMTDMHILASVAYVLRRVMLMIFRVGMVFAAIAGFDFFYQRWTFEKDIRMTKQEVKEEYKQMEGDPQIKGKIRSMQRQRAMSRMMQAVPDADVIIRNPTHYAVALKYNIHHDNAPILVAKGQDLVALKIVEIGEKNHVAVIENKVLARGIFASTPLECEIPAEYYGIVAEILVQVFRMNNVKLE